MILLSLNCRGIGRFGIVHSFKALLNKHQLAILFLMETKTLGAEVSKKLSSFRLSFVAVTELVRTSGGLWMGSKSHFVVSVLHS